MDSGLKPADDSAKLVDVAAVAALLGCSKRHVRRLAESGQMPPALKLGALVRWDRSKIQNWIADGCQPVPTIEFCGVPHV